MWKEQGAVLCSYQFFFVVCGYTKGVETQLSKLYLLVEFDEISKVFETKSVCRSMLVCICVLVCVGVRVPFLNHN